MKTLLLTSALLISATTASAFTCKNTVTMVDGEWSYTSSQCGNQAPASAEVLEMITYTANNPSKDKEEEEEVVTEEVVTEEVTVDAPLTKLEKLKIREAKLLDKGARLWSKYDRRLAKLGFHHEKTMKVFIKAKANTTKRKKVQARIARLSK